jgi:hypothetical protein
MFLALFLTFLPFLPLFFSALFLLARKGRAPFYRWPILTYVHTLTLVEGWNVRLAHRLLMYEIGVQILLHYYQHLFEGVFMGLWGFTIFGSQLKNTGFSLRDRKLLPHFFVLCMLMGIGGSRYANVWAFRINICLWIPMLLSRISWAKNLSRVRKKRSLMATAPRYLTDSERFTVFETTDFAQNCSKDVRSVIRMFVADQQLTIVKNVTYLSEFMRGGALKVNMGNVRNCQLLIYGDFLEVVVRSNGKEILKIAAARPNFPYRTKRYGFFSLEGKEIFGFFMYDPSPIEQLIEKSTVVHKY